MGRGLITGLIFGAVFSGAGLVTLSLVNDLPIDGTPPIADETPVEAPVAGDVTPDSAGDVTDESPIVADSNVGLAPEAPAASVNLPMPDIESVAPPEVSLETGNVADLPEAQTEAPTLPATPSSSDTPHAVQSPAAGLADSAPLIEGPAANEAAPVEDIVETPVDDVAPEPLIEEEEAAPEVVVEAEPDVPELETPVSAAPRLGTTAGSLVKPETETETRLPGTDDAPDGLTTEAPIAPGEPVEELPAVVTYGAPYDGDLIAPIMSALFVDVPNARPTVDMLAQLPVGVTFAVDPTSENAADAIATYRGAGHEVILVLNTPAGGQPSDVDQAFQSTLADFPETIGVISNGTSGFQSNRAQIQQVITNLADQGHGLLLYPQGLNAGLQLAEKEDVPAALTSRTIDDAGETVSAMSRILSRIAFQASKDQTAIAVAHTGTGALEAYGDWVAAGKTNGVNIAPVSVLLQVQ